MSAELNTILYLTGFIIALALAIAAFIFRSLTLSGSISGFLIAYIIIIMRGTMWFIPLLTFFIIGMLATGYKKNFKRKNKLLQKIRGARNAIGNAGIALLMALIGNIYGFIGSLSTAAADTISSELGVLSKTQPRMITNFKKVKTGTNGGITFLGTALGLIAAVAVSLTVLIITNSYRIALIGVISGVLGCIIDSYIGALVENKKIKGRKIIGNSGTNLIATFFGALIAIALSYYI